MSIVDYTLHRVHLTLPLPIGDSQVRFEDHWLTVLELTDAAGRTGVGFELQQGMPTPALAQLRAQFEYRAWPMLKKANPFGEALRITRPRGGNVGAAALPLATETALWDLMGKTLDLPLYQLLGGTTRQVPAYGSTLDFRLSDEQFGTRLEDFKRMGFQAVKVKVGHPDVQWDLRRLRIVHDVMGQEIDLMIDANEAWSPKEAIRRAHRYRDEGFNLFWIEDPITREDYVGYARLCAEIPFTRINTGEYLDFSGKRRLLEAGGVDVLNIHGAIGTSRAAARLAGDFGVPVALGNTIMEIGVHLAASLPECPYMEFSDLAWNRLAREPVRFENGFPFTPERPGHGIQLDRDALQEYSCPE
ncbi:MAG: mandelate racemase/muconate lactonizing enzyme family protein [Pirellulales bacterium]